MRLLSIHPKYLDKHALIALWREGLLAQKALSDGASVGKDSVHLVNFKNKANPVRAIGSYLSFVAAEGAKQGCRLNHERILHPNFDNGFMEADAEQMVVEFEQLKARLKMRDKPKFKTLKDMRKIEANPVFNLQ